MQPDQQQRIMGYFIEEAKDHLNTIEQGLLNLQNTIEDPEMVNEVFRAAHSVKGGAAMLGLSSIQRVSHRLEDFFKLLKETPVRVDQKLETLFLKAFDSLQELLGQLQGPFGLTEESANAILTGVEPTFDELEQHLAHLTSQSGGISLPTTTGFGLDTAFSLPVSAQVEESLVSLFRTDVTLQLRDMLRLFRLSDADPATRQQLQESCDSLSEFGERYGLSNWCHLLQTTRQAIAHSNNSYRILAPVVIKDIKQAQELVLAGRESDISPSSQLQDLLPFDASVETVVQDDLADLLTDLQPLSPDSELSDQSLDLAEFDFAQPTTAATDRDLDSLDLPSTHELELLDSFAAQPFDARELETQHGPEVGMTELNTLADLFEGDVPDLGSTWQQEEVIEDGDDLLIPDSSTVYNADFSNDFSDLLFEEAKTDPPGADQYSAANDLDDLFGDDDLLAEGEAASSSDFSWPDSSANSSEMDEIDELLQVTELSSPDNLDQGLLDPFSDLDNTFSDTGSVLDLTNDLVGLEAETEPVSEENQTDEALNNLNDLFDGLDDRDLATEEQPQASQSPELGIPDPWEVASEEEQVGGGPELGALSLEDLNLDDLNGLEEFSDQESAPEGLVADPLQAHQNDSLSLTEPVVSQDAIADPWQEPETTATDSRPLSDLSLDELEATEDFSLESPVPVEDLALELSEFDSNGQLDETLINQLTAIDGVLSDSEQPTPATDDRFEAELVEDLLDEDLFGETTESASPSSADDLFSEASDPFASVNDLLDEPDDGFTSTDDLFSETNEPLPTSDVDNLFGESADESNLEVDDLFGELTDESDLAVDGLFGETNESLPISDVDDLFGEPVGQSVSTDDLFGETNEPLPTSDVDKLFGESDDESDLAVDDLFGESAGQSVSTDDLFGETNEFQSTSDVDKLFGESDDESDLAVDDLFGESAGQSVSTDDLFGETNELQSTSEVDNLFGESDDESDLAVDDLFGETNELQSTSEVDNLFGESVGSSASMDDLFGETAEPPLTANVDNLFGAPTDQLASVNGLFSEPTNQATWAVDDLFGETNEPPSTTDVTEVGDLFGEPAEQLTSDHLASVDGLFGEPTDVTSGSDVDDLFGGLTLEGVDELPSDNLDRGDTDFAFSLEPPDEITNILEEEEAIDFPNGLEDEASQLSEQELDDLLGGASDQELDDLLDESFNLDSELMGGLDLEADAIAAPAPTEDFSSLDALLNEGSSDVPTTAPLEEASAVDGLDELDQFLVADSAAMNYEALDLDPGFEGEQAVSDAESELDFGPSFSESEFSATEFGELDSLLDTPSASDDDFFGDLEGLLDDNQIPEPETYLEASPTTEMFGEDLPSEQEPADAFSDLETLVEGSALGLTAAGAMGLAGSIESTPNAGSSEFDDLDDLLKDAEEKMGGSPSVSIGRGAIPQARRIMRPGRVFSEQTMRVPVKHLDNLSNLVGELVVNRNSLEQDQERLRQSLDNLLYQVQQLSDVGQRMQDLYERSLLESSLLASRQSHQRLSALPSPGRGATVTEIQEPSGNVEYDPLEMDRFTGFHSLSQEMIELIVRVRESSSDIEFIVDETEQVTRMFRQVTTQLQEGLTRSRMVPFAQTADRLPRAVRDISMKVGKQAELMIEGRETLIDKMILEQLYDPMTHLVNNALTHGIEPPERRRAQGKPPAGRIVIRAFHQGNQTIISVFDDGSGIDVERVKAKAIEKGLITAAEAQHLSRLDIYDILFHPGFSTKDQADDFSGRGVGMDVVRTSLSEIRGVVNIDSTPGKGTTFTIRLPLTLSISKALCCISDRARIAFPMDGVEDMLDLPKERLQVNAEGQPCIAWRDTILPVRPLSELLAYNRHLSRGNVYGGNQEDDIISIVVLRSAGNFLALQVDQVLGEQEIVIKQLEGPVPKPAGVAGATVLGDGRIMPIADVLELIDLSVGRLRRDAGGALWDQNGGQEGQEAPVVKTEPMVLIVDDSITVRELLSMTFNKVGYRVEQARDGQEAWEKLRSGLPCDIVFCDIEMPRMDGLELLSRIQKDPNLKHLPIAMLTSRGADRHRQMAASLGASGYFTKPYLEEALLDAAQRMLKGERLLSNEG